MDWQEVEWRREEERERGERERERRKERGEGDCVSVSTFPKLITFNHCFLCRP